MRRVMMLFLALLFAVGTIGVAADDVFARGGGGGGGGGSSSGGGGGSAPGPAAASGDPGTAGDPDGPRNTLELGVLALPRFGTVVVGCMTSNFGAEGGVAPCPINR